jgi:3-oxoacyl-[acyl-carrier protein] reductase
MVCDIHQANARIAVDEIVARGGNAIVHHADVTRVESVQKMVQAAVTRFGRLDILVSNAGGATPTPLENISPDEYHRLIALNLDSVYYGVHAALPVMLAQGGGVFLSIASGAGLGAVTDLAIYGAAKAGMINLMRSVAVDYGSRGIRANTIAPGPMDTPGLRAWLDTTPVGAAGYAAQVPVGRLGTAEGIAAAAAFLVSDDAAYVSGVVLPVDGAIHARLASPNSN